MIGNGLSIPNLNTASEKSLLSISNPLVPLVNEYKKHLLKIISLGKLTKLLNDSDWTILQMLLISSYENMPPCS
jgi:hypothetical protein